MEKVMDYGLMMAKSQILNPYFSAQFTADSSTGNTPQSIQPSFANLPIIWDIFKNQALITCPLSMEKNIFRLLPECDVMLIHKIYFFIFGLWPDLMKTINIYLLQF